MKYIKYNVELNDQIFSIELPEIDWFLGHKLKSNKIPFTKENIEEEKESNYYKDEEKRNKFIENLIYAKYPELKDNLNKLNNIIQKLKKEFKDYDNIYISGDKVLDEGFNILISFDYGDSYLTFYSFKYDGPLNGTLSEETNKILNKINKLLES